MNFGEVLTRAWQIVWRNKILWIFGLLAALAAGGDNGGFPRWANRSNSSFPGPVDGGGFPIWLVPLLILFGLVLIVVVILLGTLGHAGLMRGAWLADSGEGGLSFRQVFEEGRKYFLRVLILEVLLVGAALSLVMVLVLPTIFTLGIAFICLWPLFLLLGPLFFGLSVVFKLAIAAVTGEDLGVSDGLRRAWQVVRVNLPQVIAISLILLLIGYVISQVLMIPAAATLAPLILGTFAGGDGFVRGGAVLTAILFLLYLPVLLAAGGLLTAYLDSAWVVIFRRLTGRAAG